jgi:dTDP-6-deoxy-L-talose 4-dehydrogenase (NAD+)
LKKVLITGGTGFVGQQIVKALLKREATITLVVRKGKEKDAKELCSVANVISSDDIFSENQQWWASACTSIDTVVHSAWYVEPGKYLESKKNLECLAGSLALVGGAEMAKIERFIGIGTCFEYKMSTSRITVETPLQPLSTYAASKAALYTFCSEFLPKQKIEFAWCRLFNLYGEGEKPGRLGTYIRYQLIENTKAQIKGASLIRDFMDVKEAGDAIARIALSRNSGQFNICSGIPLTVKDFAEGIADEQGKKNLLDFQTMPDSKETPCIVGVPSVIYNSTQPKPLQNNDL